MTGKKSEQFVLLYMAFYLVNDLVLICLKDGDFISEIPFNGLVFTSPVSGINLCQML